MDQNSASTAGSSSVTPTSLLLTPLGPEGSVVDPVEALRPYGKMGRRSVGDISPSPTPLLVIGMIEPVTNSTVAVAMDGCNLGDFAPAGKGSFDFGEKLEPPHRSASWRGFQEQAEVALLCLPQLGDGEIGSGTDHGSASQDVDVGYLQIRQELKEKLISWGHEWIWLGLEAQDDSRVEAISEVDEAETETRN